MCALVLPFAHSGIRVTFTDVARDPGWPDHYRDLSIRNGIRAAWSEPILTKDNHVFGTSARCQNGAVLLATLSFIVGAVVKFNPSGPRGMMCFPSRRTFVLLWLFGVIIAMPVENGLAQCAAIASTPRAASDCATHELSDEIIATIDPKHSYSLAELIDIAERNNPRTRIVWEQAKQKARQLGIERSSYYPVLAAMATFGDQRIIDPFPKPLAPLGYTVDEIPPAQPGITLEYLLFDFGKRKARIDAAKAAALAAGAIFIQANQEVAFAVASDFYKLVTAQERLQAAQETLKTAQTTQDAAEDRLQNGRATLPDVLNAWAETSEAVFDMESADGVEGPILRLNVADHQRVASGDLLFEIDDRPYKYALDHATSDQAALEGQIVDEQRRIQAEVHAVDASGANTRNATANVDRAQASIREAEADVAHSQAALDRAKAEWTYAANNLHRVEPWLTKQFVTVDQVDQARTAERASDQALHEAESQLALSQAHLNSMRAELAQARASFEQSTAQLQQSQSSVLTLDPLVAQRQGRTSAISSAQYNYDHTRINAPFDGRVTNLLISEGAYAHVGQEVFTLIDTRVWWVIANFRETQLKHIRPCMEADVYVMSAPDSRFTGVVESIGYGVTPDPSILGRITSGLPEVQRTLSWVHLASRYPVRIRIQSPPSGLLRLGESAVVMIRGNEPRR